MPTAAEQHQLRAFAQESLGRYGLASFGIAVSEDAPVPRGWTLAHDEREAPYALADAEGSTEDEAVMLSKTDEGDLVGYVWASYEPGQRVVGVGLDLASADDFGGEYGPKFARLIFSPAELELAGGGTDPLGSARVFAGKEAAFKACGPALRRYYRAHDVPELFFETRDIEVMADGSARGIRRIGDAETGLAALGIERIELYSTTLRDMALVVAVALG